MRAAALLGAGVCAAALPAQQLLWERTGVPGQSALGQNSVTVGGQIANLGDLDGDGCDDLILIGMDIPSYTSQLWIFSGRDGRTIRTVPQVPGPERYPYHRVAAAGDMDGDGTPDYVTTLLDQNIPAIENVVQVRSGRDDSVIWSVRGPWPELFGRSLLGNLDLDGDARPDIVLTAPRANGQSLGAVYAYANDGSPLWQVHGTSEQLVGCYANWGTLARVGDVDGDGADDLVAGGYDVPAGSGAAVVLSGRTGGVIVKGLDPQQAVIGPTVDGGGDFDGDGVPDFVAGDTYGVVIAFSGRTGAVLFRWQAISLSTYQVASNGVDLDQDGVADVVAGALSWPTPGGKRGAVFAFSGRDGTQLFRVDAQTSNYSLGFTVGMLRPHPNHPFGLLVVTDHSYGPYLSPGAFWQGRIAVYRGAPPGVEPIGAPCAGTLPSSPRIGIQSRGAAGARIHLSSTPPGSPAALLIGISAATFGALPLPLSLGPLGFRGCELHTSVELVLPALSGSIGSARGYGFVDIPLPLTGSEPAVPLHGQWLVLGAGSAWPGGCSAALRWRHSAAP